jgi:DNA adenine methylase
VGVKAPFIWFGGKRRVAPQVWAALGDVDNYVEPFAGSIAVLLERPAWHRGRAETINDADHYVANFWRALAADPEGVALAADWPVNEGRARIASMEADPEFYDVKVAGWWVWGLNAWIGSGWCSGVGPWTYDTISKLPHLGDAGQGVNRKLPHLGDAGQGVNRQLPHLGDAGQGVNRQLPHLGTAGQAPPGGVSTASVRTSATPDRVSQILELADRLRLVRVCCGDWQRVTTNGALNYGATVGVFLDPPYLGDVRTSDLYAVDDHTIAHEVREWCLAHGDDPRLRIVLAGYVDEHDHLMPDTWRRYRYSASLGYGTTAGGGQNAVNRHKETLWFSPGCLDPSQGSLFGEAS